MAEDCTYYRAEGKSLAIIQDWFRRKEQAKVVCDAIWDRFGGNEKVGGLIETGLIFHRREDVVPPLVIRKRIPRWCPQGHFSGARVYASPDNTKAGRELRAELRSAMSFHHNRPTIAAVADGHGGGFVQLVDFAFERIGDTIIIKWPNRLPAPFGGKGEPNTLVPLGAVKLKHSEYWTLRESLEADNG